MVTIRGNGLPQLSNVVHQVGQDGVVRVSIATSRAKYRNLVRRPWAALHVTRSDFSAYVVLEGEVTLSPVATDPGDATVDELVEYYRMLAGEHPNWDEYRHAMVEEERLVVRMAPTRAYGAVPPPPPDR